MHPNFIINWSLKLLKDTITDLNIIFPENTLLNQFKQINFPIPNNWEKKKKTIKERLTRTQGLNLTKQIRELLYKYNLPGWINNRSLAGILTFRTNINEESLNLTY